MVKFDDVKDYIYEDVSVGLQHSVIPNRLFYYYGFLEEANDEFIKIQMRNGVKQIPLNQIMEIKSRGR